MTHDPPEAFSLPVVRCPSCGHGIDPHGLEPGDYCGVGDENMMRCTCLWSPNDIAATLRADLRDQVQALHDEASRLSAWNDLDVGLVAAYRKALALIDGNPDA